MFSILTSDIICHTKTQWALFERSVAHGVKRVAQVPLGRIQIHFCNFNGGKMVSAPGSWSKRDLSPLINHRRVLGVTRGKPIRVSSPIPFNIHERCHFGGLLL